MNTKHTPGPWIVDDVNHPGDCRSDHVSGGYHYIDAGKGFLDDATGQGFGISGCISLADALLIAAAPDLLAALRNIEDVLGRMAEQNPGMNMFPLVEARAAIAKAEAK